MSMESFYLPSSSFLFETSWTDSERILEMPVFTHEETNFILNPTLGLTSKLYSCDNSSVLNTPTVDLTSVNSDQLSISTSENVRSDRPQSQRLRRILPSSPGFNLSDNNPKQKRRTSNMQPWIPHKISISTDKFEPMVPPIFPHDVPRAALGVQYADFDQWHPVMLPSGAAQVVRVSSSAEEELAPRTHRSKPKTIPLVRRFTPDDRIILSEFYQRNRYPSRDEKVELANRVGRSILDVTRWFNNQRQRTKKNFGKKHRAVYEEFAPQSRRCLRDATHRPTKESVGAPFFPSVVLDSPHYSSDQHEKVQAAMIEEVSGAMSTQSVTKLDNLRKCVANPAAMTVLAVPEVRALYAGPQRFSFHVVGTGFELMG